MRPTTLRHLALVTSLASTTLGCTTAEDSDDTDTAEIADAATVATPITSGFSGKCLGDSGGSTANGNPIDLYTCNGTTPQNWLYTGGTFVGAGGKCLDIVDGNQSAGAAIDLYTCNGSDAQKWTVSGTAIKSTAGLCLDVKNGVDANGTRIQLATCADVTAQVWHVASTPTNGPHVVQTAVHQSPSAPPPYTATAPFEGNSVATFKNKTTKGNTIWVAVTVSDYGGVHSISVNDSQHNVYTQLDQENDGRPGAQTVAHFYAKNIAGDGSSPNAVTVDWGSDNYKGVVAVELAGTTTAPMVAHDGVIQDGLAKGTGNVQSGALAASSAQVPGLLVSLSMSTDGGASDTGGTGCGGPSAGAGFTSVASIWNWSTVNLATLETEAIPAAGSKHAVFSAPCSGPYVTVAALFH